MPVNSESSQRKAIIAVDIGRYNFIDANGWREYWNPRDALEWWDKYQWEKDGGYSQEPLIYSPESVSQ